MEAEAGLTRLRELMMSFGAGGWSRPCKPCGGLQRYGQLPLLPGNTPRIPAASASLISDWLALLNAELAATAASLE